jgi:ribose 5-phosphate isomerase B
MKVAIGADMVSNLGEVVCEYIRSKGHEVVLVGALVSKKEEPWPIVAKEVAEKIIKGECDEGVVMCWTGTGVTIAANKIKGIRAALCFDAETAKGARKWNHANILTLSIRLTSEHTVKEIIDAWYETSYDEKEKKFIDMVSEIEKDYMK